MDMPGLQNKIRGDNHKLVEFEYCDKHFYIKYINMTEIEYKIMKEKEHIH